MSARYPHDDEVCRQNSIDAASFPDLCRQVARLQAERDELRAEVARVEALAGEWKARSSRESHYFEKVMGDPVMTVDFVVQQLRWALAVDQP